MVIRCRIPHPNNYITALPTLWARKMSEQTETVPIDRSEPLELDTRGRVTIPSNIREKHGIHPSDNRTIWLEINIEEAEIHYEDDEGGDSA